MRELADRLDMTTAALYYHYADKADILVQLVEPMLVDTDRLVAAAPEASSDIEQRLEALLDLLLAHRAVFRLLSSDVSARAHPAIAARVDDHNLRLFRYIAGPERDDATMIRTVAVFGLLSRPIMTLDYLDISTHRDLLLDAAAGVYRATGRRRRRTSPPRKAV